MVLANDIIVKMVHKVESTKTTMLPNRDINAHAHETEFDYLNISLVHQHNVFELGVV